jgi:hypothetical protein
MNACRVAIRPTSRMKKKNASGKVAIARAATPSRTASPPPMKRSSRCPARMLAKSRTESEIRRAKCEIASITKMNPLKAGFMSSRPGGSQLAKYLKKPFARMPSMWYENQTTSVSTSGIERFAVAA